MAAADFILQHLGIEKNAGVFRGLHLEALRGYYEKGRYKNGISDHIMEYIYFQISEAKEKQTKKFKN